MSLPPFALPSGKITPNLYKRLILQLDPGDDEKEMKIRDELERKSGRNIRKAFRDMMDTLYPERWGDNVDPMVEADKVSREFRQNQQLKDAVARALLDGVDLGVSVGVTTLEGMKFGFDYTLVHVAARDWAQRYTDELLSQLASTTQRGVGQAIARWVENEEDLQALKSDLEPFFGKARADRIAVTEVTRAFFKGSEETYRQSGVVKRLEWQTARDEIVAKCIYCEPMQFRRTDIGQPWQHPNFGAITIPAHVNCRCWSTPVVGEAS